MQLDSLSNQNENEEVEMSPCLACENVKKKDYENFLKNYSLLRNKSRIKFKTNDLLNSIQQLISCIGCRTSVEKFYKQLISSSSKFFNANNCCLNTALDPLQIDVTEGFIYLNNDYMKNSKSLYNLFYIHG